MIDAGQGVFDDDHIVWAAGGAEVDDIVADGGVAVLRCHAAAHDAGAVPVTVVVAAGEQGHDAGELGGVMNEQGIVGEVQLP